MRSEESEELSFCFVFLFGLSSGGGCYEGTRVVEAPKLGKFLWLLFVCVLTG